MPTTPATPSGKASSRNVLSPSTLNGTAVTVFVLAAESGALTPDSAARTSGGQGGDPGPGVVDLAGQVVGGAAVVDDPIGPGQAVRPGRLPGHAGPGVG